MVVPTYVRGVRERAISDFRPDEATAIAQQWQGIVHQLRWDEKRGVASVEIVPVAVLRRNLTRQTN